MSTFRNPVGPQSPQVYWRRRLLLGLGILVVIIVVVLIIVRPGSGDDTPKTDASNSQSPDASTTPSTQPSEQVQSEGDDCKTSSLKLEAVTDKDVYGGGEQPQISMTVTNVGAVACMLNAGSTQQVLTITSGEETYWSSTDCQVNPVDAPILLEPNDPKSTPAIAWDRTRSSTSTCEAERSAVPAGGASYHLSVKIGELASAQTRQFILN
ncbi:hypothetical protein FB562_2543 [Homoserinimonas aerilata]|uniref:DUF4232 domain-containing protein n=1 Tax=Homoserinimonas aerilata TaxID=1162970 RepID=A0A542Y1J5_9MICO|nr:hypothetical protein [Homoserinimonas aerilata]TQL41956.1 hypothetical protein FB562_2543 [Homoserinimonas aerilata]